jgi:glycosyltransferase involved in cell wall biosynthesis
MTPVADRIEAVARGASGPGADRAGVRAAAAAPIRVMHVISTLEAGGTELAMIRLLRGLGSDAYRFQVAWLRGMPSLGDEVRSATGRNAEPIGLRFKVDPAALYRLLRLARRFRPDIIHTHMDLADYYGAAAAKAVGARLVSSKQNADAFRVRRTWKRPPFLLLEHAAYAAADAVIAVSSGLVDYLARVESLPRHKTVVIGNGVDPDLAAAAPSRAEARRALGIPEGAAVLGTVGRLAEQKGQIDLIRALPLLRADIPELLCLIAGDGPLREPLAAEARRLGVADRLHLLGHRTDIPNVLAALDLFVLPSLWEGLPQALLEAMAMSLPVLAARGVGADDLVIDEENGLLIPPRDPAAIAAAVRRLLRDRPLARRLGDAARRSAADGHSLAGVAAQVDALYRRLLRRDR